jgi:tetratricopeptide (TPR) repeat protein
MVVERSSGNPLYAEQFVRLLADRGVADPAGDMPDTIRALIAARLAGLSPAQHAVLLDAAVLGPVFWPDALANMNGPDHELVITSLRELARKELVRPSRSSSLGDRQEYAFVHGLVRDVAYEEIPAASRWQKHRAAASWLEGAGAQDVPAFAEALAHHYAEAARLGRELGEDATTMEPIEERAVRFLLRAGDAATQVDVRRAEALYRQALPMCPAGDPDRAVLLARIGDMAALTGDYNEAATLLEDATAAFLGEGKRLEAARATLDLAYATFRQAGTSREHQALDRAYNLLEGLPPSREHARAATDRAAELFFVGDSRGALAATDGALQLANEVGAQDLAARLLEIRGMSRCDLGDQGGLADLHRALAGSNELGLGPEAVRAYLNLGTFATPVEGPAAALAYFTAGATLAQRRGITELGMWTKAWELGVLFELGEWDRLLAEGREVLLWDRARGGSQLGIAAQNCMAEVLAYRDRTAEAAEMANEFVGEARAIGDPQILLPALVIAAVARSEHGDPDGAVQAVEEFAQIYPDRARWVGSLFLQVCVRVCIAVGRPDLAERLAGEPDETTRRGRHVAESARGEVAEAHGRVEDALVHHRAAAEGWASYGFPFEHAHASMGAARCLVRLGRPDEAASPADDAAGTFEGLGAMPLAGRARAIV